MISLNFWAFACVLLLSSCQKEELSFTQGDVKIDIEAGDGWLHDFPLFLGLTKKNPPQFAVWIEDTEGRYLSTVFVTYKIATEGWLSNNGNRRKEALPYWCYQRGCVYEDGLLLPTKENPLVDGITGATPKASKTIRVHPLNLSKKECFAEVGKVCTQALFVNRGYSRFYHLDLNGNEITSDFYFGPCFKTSYRDWETDRKSTRLNSSHRSLSRMPSSA